MPRDARAPALAPPPRVPAALHTREDVIAALREAAELEHGVCCLYLYAAFALRTTPGDSCDWPQAERSRGWAATLLQIAREEMGHLGSVGNLLSAIGGAPHFAPPRFPHPLDDIGGPCLELRTLSVQTLDRFMQLESAEATDKSAASLGALYARIAEAVATIDERELFIGRRRDQLHVPAHTSMHVAEVHDQASALATIAMVVDESDEGPDSHLARLTRVRAELVEALAVDPRVRHSRPAVRNPTSTVRGGETTPVTDETTLAVLRVFNTAYSVVVLMLTRLAAQGDETPAELETLHTLVYLPLMTMAIRPLGELLTTLPVGAEHPDATAGPSFELVLAPELPPGPTAAWQRIEELLVALARDAGEVVEALGPRGPLLCQNLVKMHALVARAAAERRSRC